MKLICICIVRIKNKISNYKIKVLKIELSLYVNVKFLAIMAPIVFAKTEITEE